MAGILSLILAAGQGTRMKSNLNKVLHPVGGKPMGKHVIDLVSGLNSDIVCVVGHQGDKVKQRLKTENLQFVEQTEQLGTGHAVMQAADYIKGHKGPILVLYGDTPLLTEETLLQMINSHRNNDAGLTILTARMDDPTGYGRIIRSHDNRVIEIVEEDDADQKEKKIEEINSGVYCFDSILLQEALEHLTCDNAQGEYYLTDAVSYINGKGEKVIPVVVDDSQEIAGINDRKSLAKAEKIIRQRINEFHMDNGVTIIDPDTTYIDKSVEIGKDTVIYPFTYIEGETRIGSEVVIGPHSRLVNVEIGNNVDLKANCNVRDSIIKDNCNIGPFVYIRPGSKIQEEAKVGDFVELKKAIVGKGSKVPHLSYVGDAEIGKDTNIGAGTIFANYDGKNKHRTNVGDSVFIGSNTTLIAPVEVGDGGKTGAGSVVTRDVDENTTVIGVPARIFKKENGKNEL